MLNLTIVIGPSASNREEIAQKAVENGATLLRFPETGLMAEELIEMLDDLQQGSYVILTTSEILSLWALLRKEQKKADQVSFLLHSDDGFHPCTWWKVATSEEGELEGRVPGGFFPARRNLLRGKL